jgi:indole-3-glycerol phosphate synthase
MRAAAPDLLLRIAERRRERLAEHRRGQPDAAAAVTTSTGTRRAGAAAGDAASAAPVRLRPAASAGSVAVSTASSALGAAGRAVAAGSPDVAPAPLLSRDNPFLAALAHPRRAGAAALGPAPPVAPSSALQTPPPPVAPGVPASPGMRPSAALPSAPAIIAEVKMGSPRLGSLVGRIDPVAQARVYAEHGAAALSVVVEPDFFHGSYQLLADCRAASGLPAIAKDFVVDPLQLAWARQAGADAVLLIAALYQPEELVRYAWLARGLGLAPLVEVHDAEDLALLDGQEWEAVGVNNRDLRTFEVDLARSIALLPSLPPAALKVAESGIRDARDVALLAASGFDALLIGESLLLAADPAAHLRALLDGTAAREAEPSGARQEV